MRPRPTLFPVLAAGLALGACSTGLTVGTDDHPAHVRADGIIDGYVTLDGLQRYDGELLHAGIFGSAAREGEIVSLDVWPLFGVGAGVAGARVRILPIELALGTLWYSPSVPREEDAEVVDVDDESDDGEVDEHDADDHDHDHDAFDDEHAGTNLRTLTNKTANGYSEENPFED